MTSPQPVSTNSSDVSVHFKRLLSPHGVGARLAKFEVSEAGLPNFSATFVYPRFRQDKVLVDELCEKLVNRVTSFCMTRDERRKAKAQDAQSEYETAATDALNARARRLFIEATKGTTRSGEGGELLLFVLAEEYLAAPLLVSKMRLKTNTQMPVHGSDGIHAAWDQAAGTLVLYMGESKVHANLNGAIKDAMASVSELASDAGGRFQHELALVQNYSDLDGVPDEMKQELLLYMDPWNTIESTRRIDKFAVLIGFDEKAYTKLTGTPPGEAESKFKELYAKTIRKTMEHTKAQLDEHGVHLSKVEFFFFPVPSVESFRQTFLSKINA